MSTNINQKNTGRNKSGPNTRQAASSAMASIGDYFSTSSKPIDETQFKKADLDKKLDMMATALNKLCANFDTKIDDVKKNVDSNYEKLTGLEQKIDNKLEPLWEAIFDDEDGLKAKVTKLDETVYHDEDGLQTKVRELEKAATDMNKSFTDLTREFEAMKYEQDILKGYTSNHHDRLLALQDRTHEMAAKAMEKNISISGIPESQDEDPMQLAKDFLIAELRIENIEVNELYRIKEAFRIGEQQPNKSHTLIIKTNLFLRRKILEAAKEYRERLGRQKPQHYINVQLPDKYVEQNRMVRHLVWEQKRKDEGVPATQKANVQVQNGTVLVNRRVVKWRLPMIKPRHMFQGDEIQQKLEEFHFESSEMKLEKTCRFQAFAARCEKPEDAHLAQVRIRQLNPEVTHVITAFNPAPDSIYHYALQDDGEYGAGLKLVRFLQENNHHDVVVCVVRIFGGRHLGPRRFEVINRHAKEALDKLAP